MEHEDLRIERAPQTLRTMVLDRMRGAILSGRFVSGERLVERVLCDQLGVSRSVVREVIRYLEAEGLVESLPSKGPMVARMDWPTARQIYDIRLLLEESAARACAARIDDTTRAELRLALEGIAKASAEGRAGTGLFQATTRFYECIFRAAGHAIAWETVQRLNGRISRLRALTLSTTDRSVSGLARMTLICEAICSADPDASASAVRAHLNEAAEIARRILEQEEGGKPD